MTDRPRSDKLAWNLKRNGHLLDRGNGGQNPDWNLWPPVADATIPSVMDTTNLRVGDTPLPETDAARRHQIAWEAEMIAEADADIAAGRVVDSAKVNAWIDSIGTDHELPVPHSDG
jgi:hypothetical protein